MTAFRLRGIVSAGTGGDRDCASEAGKDDSDTQSAVNFAIDHGAERITILGATGKRIDHLMANFGLLVHGRNRGADIILVDQWNYMKLIESHTVLKKEEQFGKYVSFLFRWRRPDRSDPERVQISTE